MAQPVDPKSQASASGDRSGASAKQVYQQAVTAFKAQSYDQALALFQRLGQLPPGSSYYLKAVMGQIRVHQRLKQVDQARLGCQVLIASDSSEARQWAQQVLSQLPDSNKIEASPVPQQTASSKANLSGFVPLAATANSQPPPPALPKSAFPKTPSPPPTAKKLDQPRPEDLSLNATKAREAEATYQSLFHFQQLNQHSGIAQNDSDRPPDAPVDAAIPASKSSAEPVLRSKTTPIRQRPQTPLPKYPLGLWLQQGLTAIALLWVTNWAIHFALRTVDGLLRWVRWPIQLSLPGANQTYTVWVIGGLVLLTLASPWIMDFALAFWHGQKPLSTRQLQGHSPGALRLLRQVCRQRGWQIPDLRVIPDQAPLCFSYGWLVRNTRIVVSQGILDQGSDEAITALYGYELARMVNGSGSVLSAAGLLLLLLHAAYHRLAQIGDRLQPLLRNLLGVLSSIFYGLFWLLRQLVLWLSRSCCSWGDRRATVLTQHPDHLADGLLQFTEAIATDLEQRGSLHPLLTSLEILMPVSGRQAITPGSLLAVRRDGQNLDKEDDDGGNRFGNRATTIANLIAVDSFNPYRQWLRVSASHLPLGERLLDLSQQAILRQQPTVALPLTSSTSTSFSLALLLLQKGPLAGLLMGGSIAMGLWFLGGIVNRLRWQWLSWLYQDPSVLVGGLWLGLGLGLLLRINALFPDLDNPPPAGQTSTPAPDTIADLLRNSSVLPVQGKAVTLRGQLLGSAGVKNWGCQNLYLNDDSGLVKLVNPVPLGSFQGVFQPRCHPQQWIGQAVTVSGWSRYGGGLLWVDIHQVQLDPHHRFQAYGPIWATLLSLVISLIGILAIFRGG